MRPAQRITARVDGILGLGNGVQGAGVGEVVAAERSIVARTPPSASASTSGRAGPSAAAGRATS